MREIWKKQLTNERGATIALVAVCLVTLAGAAALAIDLGMLYDARNQAQRTADAAALAGASVFLNLPADVEAAAIARAERFAAFNRVAGRAISPADMEVDILDDPSRVRVTVTRGDIPLWFARVFGRNSSVVTATAVAAAETSGSVTCLRPIAFADLWHERTGSTERYSGRLPSQPPCAWGDGSCDYYEPTETGRGQWWRNAGMPGPDGKGEFEAPAKPDDVGRLLTFDLNRHTVQEGDTERLHRFSYYPLRIPGCSGGDCWRQGLSGQTCTGTISIGDAIVTEPGVQVGPTNQGWQAAYDADPNARWDEATNTIRGSRYPLGCSGDDCTGTGSPRIVTVAMVDPASRIASNASGTLPIQNFSAFFLVSWEAGGQTNRLTARWMKPRAVADNCRERGNCRENLVTLRLVE